ncbi:DUF317 domain-containing protein [Streptomyces tanashiensis]|uniref:DUF317 domain-containing protein n=1 Tax=Streptomyces tanashiensis TaxID=67367 RepID=UPI0027E584D0|nr:DUF317 domain-containing protein [Streptomyces tanashiensis]
MSTWTTAQALDYVEAPLYPQHSSDSHLPNPPYWVAPRRLAGDDDALADQVGAALTSAGWRMWPTVCDTLLYGSRNELCGAEWTRAACPFELSDLPVAWQVSARSHPASALPEWNAYFTAGVPNEALTDFLLALDARQDPASSFDGPETVLAAVCAQGWVRDIDLPTPQPSLPARLPASRCRQAWAEPGVGDPYLWCASSSVSVPPDLVAIFASSLASPRAPVHAARRSGGAAHRHPVRG